MMPERTGRPTSGKEVPVGRGEGEDAEESSHPVANVSHDDGVAFCAWLTKRDRASGLIGPQDEYRLPTDTEWSYAVGIGDKEDASASPKEKDWQTQLADIYPWGGSFTAASQAAGTTPMKPRRPKAVTFGPSLMATDDGYATTAPVGSFKANSLGLHDLGGNLWEWTSSEWESGSTSRVLRGASWLDLMRSRFCCPPTATSARAASVTTSSVSVVCWWWVVARLLPFSILLLDE
jgi:formylglycine-generating enzyme required for sulfatase activity